MAVVSGLTSTVTVAGNDISSDVTAFTLDTPYGVLDISAVSQAATARLLLRADATGTLSGFLDTAGSKAHATLKTPGSKTFVLAYPGATATFTAVTSNYSLNVDADGSAPWSCNYALSSGTAVAWT